MPSPPPPYSPSAPEAPSIAAITSPIVDNATWNSSPVPAQHVVRQSPQIPMSPAFPPPPSGSSRHRDRSSSSNQRNFFSLAGIRGKQPVYDSQPNNTFHVTDNGEPRPPGARRAASTGHLQSSAAMVAQAHAQGSGAAGRGSPDSTWQPGMPLPGPPPGAPPPGARSQSLNRYAPSSRSNSIASERSIDAPPQRRPTAAASSTLGPIPPTPADWIDPDAAPPQQVMPDRQMSSTPEGAEYHPLRIDTGATPDTGLSRRHAKRDGSAQGLRERRSRSRADRSSRIFSPADAAQSNDLVFATTDGSISRRREHTRTISAVVDHNIDSSSGSSGATKKPIAVTSNSAKSVLTPPYTPAVGKSTDDLSRKPLLRASGSASSDRPISHLLHQPLEDSSTMPAALTPSRPASSGSARPSAKLDPFALQAIERHRAFVEKEALSTSDEERLELFANFMVHESRLRRDRYTIAYNAMAGDILDLTRDMWRSYTKQGKRVVTPSTMSSFDATVPSSASDGQPASAQGNMPSSASSYGDYTPGTDANSLNEFESPGMERSDSRQWGETFKPSLSPIPSMAVSTVPDEGSSRGRQPARWWEQGSSGEGSIGKPDRIQKTLRETKYMGINPAMLQDNDQPTPNSGRHTGSTPGPSNQAFAYGPDEYPPEKVGWHENGDFETPIPTPSHLRKSSTPGGMSLDVSRLVTLPPPYPRHHPALNNNHPLMADLRGWHRELADRSRVQEIRDAYFDQDFAIQKEQQEAAKERKAKLRLSIQGKIANGSISFADAAQAESDFDLEEAERGKASARSNFDVFETSLAQPLNALLTERLHRADTCINQLRVELQARNESSDPNQAQEEGDEEPERLEKLTLLKWIFEAREQLHKEMFDFHADRAAKYSEVILTPYRIARLQAKMDEATAFFAKDSRDRQTAYTKDSVKRFVELQSIMELNVSRGVEDQLSAFWDIAPGLLELIQHLPANPAELEIHIPNEEYDENPVYQDHPLQYLYSLLSHAQKSAYQFIEGQINLLCLLHEVRTTTTKASLKVLEIERSAANPGDESVIAEMEGAMIVQEERLTEDLKEKVGEVERQWNEALGDGIEDCRERVRGFLEETGGWEDGLEG